MEKNINEIPIKATPTQSDKIIGFDNATGEAIAVPISAIARQGTNGQSLEVQYSQDGEIWHYPGEATDIYMRQRLGSADWGVATRINIPDSTLNGIREEIEVDFSRQLEEEKEVQKGYTDDAIKATEDGFAKQLEEEKKIQKGYTDDAITATEVDFSKQLEEEIKAQKKYTDDAIRATEDGFAKQLEEEKKAQKGYTDDAITATEVDFSRQLEEEKEVQKGYTDDAIRKAISSVFINQQIVDDSIANDEPIGVFFFLGFKNYDFKGKTISSENLILTSNIDPIHGYGEQTYKWIEEGSWRIIGRIKKAGTWSTWIEYL